MAFNHGLNESKKEFSNKNDTSNKTYNRSNTFDFTFSKNY